jgi:hypothetical protein
MMDCVLMCDCHLAYIVRVGMKYPLSKRVPISLEELKGDDLEECYREKPLLCLFRAA